ncbi:MAG: tryptophan synthase subunit alpha [Burkholderiales bacterium]|nr:tryptophan synthase subunit alpha [Burkholderiales bacterium]
MARIENCFARLKKENKKALIPYICAGDPSPSLTVPIMHALVRGGADVIELGVPFSDPMADGKTIQYASERALIKGMTLRKVLDLVNQFRGENSTTPVVLMGYANPIERMGIDTFVKEASDAGVDGVLVVDYPPQESIELKDKLHAEGIDTIYLLAPTSTQERIQEVVDNASGYIYYVTVKGVTGTKKADAVKVASKLPEIRKDTSLPICVGFGIKDAQSAADMARIADGVIIGSRLVIELQQAGEKAPQKAEEWLGQIRTAMDAPIS